MEKKDLAQPQCISNIIIESILDSIISLATQDARQRSAPNSDVNEDGNEPSRGALAYFGEMRRNKLGKLLGASERSIGALPITESRLGSKTDILNKHGHVENQEKVFDSAVLEEEDLSVDVYPRNPPITFSIPREELTTNWVYADEDGDIQLVKGSTKWIMDWLISRRVMHASFTPVFNWDSAPLSPEGRQRNSGKLTRIRKSLCGEFKFQGDFFKAFKCSFNNSYLHSCPSVLYVAVCSKHVKDDRKTIALQCAWSDDCKHHKDDKSRGKARKGHQMLDKGLTPHEITLQVVKAAPVHALASGNNTYGSTNRETVRRQMYVQKTEEYCRGTTVVGSIAEVAKEMAEEDMLADPSKAHPFYGLIHDVMVMDSGDLNSVSIYSSLSLEIAAAEVKGNPDATAVIDCTGGLVSPIWISSASEMAQRAHRRSSKKPKRYSNDRKSMLFDVLIFHLVFKLTTGPFVACETVLVGRNANTFYDILQKFRRRLGVFGVDAQHIKHFVSDMAIPLTISVIEVFNGINVLEYMTVLLFSAKANNKKISDRYIKTRMIWCTVHGQRAMKCYAKEGFKRTSSENQKQMMDFFGNVWMAMYSSKTYSDLCKMIGFLDRFFSMEAFKALPESHKSDSETVVRDVDLFQEGETIIWMHLGGVPKRMEPEYLYAVMVNACRDKGYNSAAFEEANTMDVHEHNDKSEIGIAADKMVPSENDDKSSTFAARNEATEAIEGMCELDSENTDGGGSETDKCMEDDELSETGISEAEKGVYTYHFGPFDVYIVYREGNMSESRSRYRVYIPCLSLLENTIGGFSLWRDTLKSDEVTLKGLGYVCNQVNMGGNAAAYLKRQWYPNLALLSPALYGDAPIRHNTSVELSNKIVKNHTDVGLIARQVSGIKVVEYVKKSALARRELARNVSVELKNIYTARLHSDTRRKRIAKEEKAKTKRQVEQEQVQQKPDLKKERLRSKQGREFEKEPRKQRKKRKTMHELSEELDPTISNQQLVKGVFAPKRDLQPNLVTNQDTPEDIPLTQQSQRNAVEVDESYCKSPKRSMTPEEQERFRLIFRTARREYFQDESGSQTWNGSRIAEFFTSNVLCTIDRKMDKSVVSRICGTGRGRLPGRVVCHKVMEYIERDLVKRTVDNEYDLEDFHLLPGAVRKVHKHLRSSADDENQVLSEFGDTTFQALDFRRLVRLESWSGEQSQFWITDNAVNLMTNLFAALLRPEDPEVPMVYYFSSLTARKIHDVHFGVGFGNGLSEQGKNNEMRRIISTMANPRSGQRMRFSEAQIAFAPCHVNGNHWVGIEMDKKTRRVICLDSKMARADAWKEKEDAQTGMFSDTSDKYGQAFANFLSAMEGNDWEYHGKIQTFPQQPNDMDCGVIMLIAARICGSNQQLTSSSVSQSNLSKWRLRFAHEIIVLSSN